MALREARSYCFCVCEQARVCIARSDQLHAGGGGQRDYWRADEAHGRGVTQDGAARFCVVGAGGELVQRGAGCQEEIELAELRFGALAETGVARAEEGDFVR